MNTVVVLRMVPDLVEELSIDDSGTSLDTTWLRLIINELDNHALEQAILLKERAGGQVTVVAPDAEDVDDVLFAAAAKGADRLIKLTMGEDAPVNNHALARALTALLSELGPDLVLVGVSAHNDLDGSVGPLTGELAGLPYVGYVAGTSVSERTATVRKEYPGGLVGVMDVSLPAVLGIQAAEQPPRYVAVSKIRQAMNTASIEERSVGELDSAGGPTVGRMYVPEAGARATMLEGDDEAIAAALVDIFRDSGLL